MYPTLFRNIIFPSLDRFNRTQVSRIHRFLEKSQWFPREQLETLQRDKLRSILRFTRERSDFYRQFWETADDSRRASSSHPELDGLPIVTKNDLRPVQDQFPLTDERVLRVKTSGSTGEPMTYQRTATQESWFWALRIRMWQWGGYVPGEPYLSLNLNARTAWRKKLQDVIFRCSYHGFNANQNDVDAVLHDLERKRVRHLVGYASSLFLLAQAMRQRGIGNPGVISILATGDTLFPSYRQTIEEVFGVGVVDYYGAGGEGFHLASQCEQRGLYHLHVENSVVEVLRDGRPAKPGEMGEVVVTQLDNQAMPLLRYATHDVAKVTDIDHCACGRELPLIEGVMGRVPDIVVAPDGSALVVHYFTILFEYLEGIRQFQIVQRQPDAILVRIVRDVDYQQTAIEAHVRQAIAAVTSGSLAVEYEYPESIPLSGSNKRRLVISELAKAPLAVDAANTERVVSAVPASSE